MKVISLLHIGQLIRFPLADPLFRVEDVSCMSFKSQIIQTLFDTM